MKLTEIKKKLKPHQKEALGTIKRYLGDDDLTKHSLVKMPTGTGKTGVISIVANKFSKYRNVIVIVPNATLPVQMKAEMSEEFWTNIGLVAKEIKLKPVYLFDEIDEYFRDLNKGSVLVVTVQMLLHLFKKNKDTYDKIVQTTNLVIFDEGHREPAREWSKINREMNKKTILFTATPYRNDDLEFNVHFKDYYSSYSHKSAVEDKIIKDFSFSCFNKDIVDNADQLANYLINLHKNNGDRKIIVRHDDSSIIENVVKLINTKLNSKVALGCHSSFKSAEHFINKGNKVFDKMNYSVLIHQDMLIEGLNIPALNKLVICSKFSNTKSLIQQVGRVLRNDGTDDKAKVYIPSIQHENYLEQWNKYLEFDNDTYNENYHYHDGEFKESFILKSDFVKYLKLPYSANFYICSESVLITAREVIKSDLLKRTSIVDLNEHIKDNLWVMCYEKENYSNLIMKKAYKEKSLEVCLLMEIEVNGSLFLVHFDSRGHSFPFDSFIDKILNISPSMLYKLYPTNAEFQNVKLNSTSISNTGVNSRQLGGFNIQNISTNITERLSYCQIVKGKFEVGANEEVRRYLGVSSSRVSDNKRGSLESYCSWIESCGRELMSASQNTYFERFSRVFKPEKIIYPSSILIDLSDLCKSSVEIQKGTDSFVGTNSIYAELDGRKFEFNLFGNTMQGYVNARNSKGRISYSVYIKNANEYKIKHPDFNMCLSSYINRSSSFKLFFADEGAIYFNNSFFKPNVTFSKVDLDKMDIGQRIVGLDNIKDCVDEKFGLEPKSSNIDYWQDSSVFGFLLKQMEDKRDFFANYDFTDIVCDDLNKEIADFIAIDSTNNKIALIHCKNSNTMKSASAFQDVCGQAQKNAHYLISNGIDNKPDIMKHIPLWNGVWEKDKTYNDTKNTISFRVNRKVKGTLDGAQFWNEYKRILKSSNKEVEVWLVTNGLQRSVLKSELEKEKPEEQINQLLWILYSTQEVLGELGADLKVICNK